MQLNIFRSYGVDDTSFVCEDFNGMCEYIINEFLLSKQ